MQKISVIVPVYKVENYLSRCVDSVLGQSFRNFELILVDDGSPDSCPEICDQYAERDERIHVIHQKNGGLSAARNAGIDWVMKYSDSQWLTFLDSDDWLHRDFLSRLLKAAEDEKAQIAFSDFLNVTDYAEDPELGPLQPLCMDPETAYAEHYGKCISACCALIRRELYEEERFPLGKLNEDAFITHRILFRAERVAVLEEPLYYYYTNPDSIMRGSWTPRHLDELEGHDLRRNFLREKGYAKALAVEQQVMILTVYEQIERLTEERNPKYRVYFRNLRARLRKELKQGKNLVSLNAETVWLYLMAWPALPLWHLGKTMQNWWHTKNGTG